MIAVIFEVWPKPEHRQDYFDLAADLINRPAAEVSPFRALHEIARLVDARLAGADLTAADRRLPARLFADDYHLRESARRS